MVERGKAEGRDSARGGRVGAILFGLAVGAVGVFGKRYAVQAASTAGKNWDEILKADHRAMEGLFAQLRDSDPRQRKGVIRRLRKVLTRHALEEENAVYPVIAEEIGEEQVVQLYADHAEIKLALRALADCEDDDPQLPSRINRLRRIAQDHIAREEIILSELRDQLDPGQNADLTARVRREGNRLV